MLKCSSLTTYAVFLHFSVLEYARPAWHTSLTKEQTKQIEVIQKRALRIVFHSNRIDYNFFVPNSSSAYISRSSERFMHVFL